MTKSTQKYGLPYMGSKSTIAEWVISHLPKADTLVDAFAGGCALTHAAMLSGKFNRIIANDITDAPKLFIDACNGLYKDEKRWISREYFEANKYNDPFVRLIWSFGNNQRNYIYAKDIEERKHAIHNAVNDRKTAELSALGIISQDDAEPLEKRLESVEDTMQRYQLVKRTIIKHSKNADARCETLERTARLQHLESTARLQHLESTQKDYRELDIPDGDTVIICDIPYRKTAKYLNDFDHEAFYEWALAQKHPVFICEYDMPTPPFTLIDQTLKNSQLSATTTKKATEKLFACNLTDKTEGQMKLF
jgi:site-specific DNA-adenine methylase